MLASLLGEGVVTAVGEEHQKQRKMLQKVFRLRNVKDQYGLVWRKTRELVGRLNEERKVEDGEGGEGKVEVIELVTRATLDIIGQAGFGLDFDCLANPDNELWNEYAAAFRGVGNGGQAGLVWSVLARFLPRKVVEFLPGKRSEEVGKAVKVVRRRIGEVIAAKKMAMKESDEKEEPRKDSLPVFVKALATSKCSSTSLWEIVHMIKGGLWVKLKPVDRQ
ncbi:Putative cytochrome P450 [Septoria linicola]|uniref:Cytochrome P450 n=1 Tax=Septoria linicola TaxID=215465 RepID=A0A9Q9AW34_9PEZI|nr:putative cytochrome P450 [Septoria linicola]USW55989.1 Putative cytochrome P450 [Septoria linicola]